MEAVERLEPLLGIVAEESLVEVVLPLQLPGQRWISCELAWVYGEHNPRRRLTCAHCQGYTVLAQVLQNDLDAAIGIGSSPMQMAGVYGSESLSESTARECVSVC